MARLYAVTFAAVSVTAAQDLFELTPADDKPIKIHEIRVGQYSDAKDAEDELLSIQIIRGFTASGSGGSAATPAPLSTIDTAAGCAAEVNNTTVANTGSTTTLIADSFNVRAGWLYVPTPECRIGCSQANTTIVVRITAPADAVTMNGTLVFEECY